VADGTIHSAVRQSRNDETAQPMIIVLIVLGALVLLTAWDSSERDRF
jgi:hypothetical protein